MPHPIHATHGFTPPEKRITKELASRLEELAPLFMIQVRHLNRQAVELSGSGLSENRPLVLVPHVAKVRLLAEICSILARWVSFNLWEPCEVTLFALPATRIERCAFNYRKQLAQQARALARAAAPTTPSAKSLGLQAEDG